MIMKVQKIMKVEGLYLKLEAVITKVPSLKVNAVIMKEPMIMKVHT